MQKVNKLRISVSKQRKRTKVLILENNRSIVSPTDRITSYIKQPEKGYLGSSCVIWAQPFFLLCVRISLLVGIQRCLDHLCFLFAKESIEQPCFVRARQRPLNFTLFEHVVSKQKQFNMLWYL